MRPITILVPTRTTLLLAFFVFVAIAISFFLGRDHGQSFARGLTTYLECGPVNHLRDCPPEPWIEVLAVWSDGATRFAMLNARGEWMGGPLHEYVVSWSMPPEGVVGRLGRDYGGRRR